MDGQALTFRLAGINNQNFIMRDEQTGTWWQQISGEAILGPLKGKRLDHISWDEVTFAVWRGEHPEALVLLPDEPYVFEEKHVKELTDLGFRGRFELISGKDLSWYGPRMPEAVTRLAAFAARVAASRAAG